MLCVPRFVGAHSIQLKTQTKRSNSFFLLTAEGDGALVEYHDHWFVQFDATGKIATLASLCDPAAVTAVRQITDLTKDVSKQNSFLLFSLFSTFPG